MYAVFSLSCTCHAIYVCVYLVFWVRFVSFHFRSCMLAHSHLHTHRRKRMYIWTRARSRLFIHTYTIMQAFTISRSAATAVAAAVTQHQQQSNRMRACVYLFVCMLCTISITVAVHRRSPSPPPSSSLIFYVSCVHVYIRARSCSLFLLCRLLHRYLYKRYTVHLYMMMAMMILHSFHISLKFRAVHLHRFEQDRRKCCSDSMVDRSVLYSYFHPNLMPFLYSMDE